MSGNIKPFTPPPPLFEVTISNDNASHDKHSLSDETTNDDEKQLLSTKFNSCEYVAGKFHVPDEDIDEIVEMTPTLVATTTCRDDAGDQVDVKLVETDLKPMTSDESIPDESIPNESIPLALAPLPNETIIDTNADADADADETGKDTMKSVVAPSCETHQKSIYATADPLSETNENVEAATKGRFYALRKGKSTGKCIYLQYSHMLEQLEDFPDAEHAVFDNWKDAVAFILNEAKVLSSIAPPLLEAADSSVSTSLQTMTRKFASDDINDDVAKKRMKQDISVVNDNTTTQQNSSISTWPSEVYVSVYNTDSWDLMYQSLKDFYAEAGNTDVPAGSRLGIWVARQRKEYQSYIAGKNSELTEERVEKLQAVNFLFTSAKKVLKFEQRVEEFIKFKKDNHNVDPPSNSLLYKWIYSMRKKYRDMKEDKPVSGLDQLKIKRLDEIGFSWTGTKENRKHQRSEVQNEEITTNEKKIPAISSKKELRWNELFEQLKAYKKDHGNFTVTRHGSTLGRWVSAQRLAYRKLKNGEMISPIFNEEKIQKLVDIGFDFECKRGRKSGVEDASVWDEFYEEMKKFKEKHGHCIPPTQPSTPLRRWMEKQRSEYKKIRAGEESCLTLLRIQRLNDIGFSFEAKCKPKTWEERFEELVEFKAKFGHCKVPRLYNGLGKWVADQRQKYSKLLQGKKTNMTQEKAQKLTDLGMVWVVFKLPPKEERAERKPWAERFQELLAFQNEHGHTVVPQHFPVLGHWVHTQRVHYKLMKQGRKSLMTPEQAFQLADIGFTFEVMPRKKNTVRQSLGNPYPHLPLIASGGETPVVTEVAEPFPRLKATGENLKQVNIVSTPHDNMDESAMYQDKNGATTYHGHDHNTQYQSKNDGTAYGIENSFDEYGI